METQEKQCNRHQHNDHITVDSSPATKSKSPEDELKAFPEEVRGKRGNSEDHSAQDNHGQKGGKEKRIDRRNGGKGKGGVSRRPRDTSTPLSIHSVGGSTPDKADVHRENQTLSSRVDTTLSEFVQNLEKEKSRLENDSAESVDTSSLQMLLSNLSLALDDRHAESMKLCGDAEEVREKLEAVRKILQDQINKGEEDGERKDDADSHSIKDNKVREARAQASLNNAKAALARLALEVSETSQLAAEVELAAAQAAVMAEEAQKESAKASDVMDAAVDKNETDGKAIEEDDYHEEEETEEGESHPGEGVDDEDENKDKNGERKGEGEEISRDEGLKDETIDNENDDVDDELQKLEDETSAEVDIIDGDQSKTDNEASRPSSTTSKISNHVTRPKSGKKSQMSNHMTSPSPRPTSSRRTPTEKPLEWPHYILHLSEDPSDEIIGCIIRSNDDVIEENPNTFICRLAPDLSTSVVSDSEELVCDVVVIEEVTTEDDYSKEDEDNREERSNDIEETAEENSEEDHEGAEQVSKETENPRIDKDENNNTHIKSDDHKDQKIRKEYRLVVAIPYTVTPRMATSREFVVKIKAGPAPDWSIPSTLATESVFPEHKGPFIEVRVNVSGNCAFAVVARPITDRLTITKKGGFMKSSTDSRISLTYPVGISSLMTASLQVQPAEQAVSELRSRMKHCSDLITASPILHLTHSSRKGFEQPVTLALSCPPNPFKAASSTTLSSSKADEKQDKSDKPGGMPPSREDGVVIRSTKSSIFGGDPSEDALHLLHRPLTAKSWATLDDITIKQTRKDVVTVDLDKPYDRLLVLRMTADCRYPVENVANTFEQALQIKYSKIILAHKVDDLENAVVLCVPSRQVEGVLRKLSSDGYEAPSEMSEELPLTEGMEIEMRVTGNIKVVNHEIVKLIFHSQRRTNIDLRLDVANPYGNYSSSDYRGMLEFYGRPKIVLQDMEDPEEILLREAEAKVEAKKGQRKEEKKEKKAKENKEQIQNVSKNVPHQLCKIPVSLPKRDREVDLTASQTRAKIADVPGITCNVNLEWLAGELGNEWESLAAYLGMKSNRMQSIKRNFPGNQTAQIFNMLITWRSRMPKSYDKERKLLRALVRCGRYDLSEELKYREEEFDAEETDN
ncbi:Death domain-containing protein 1 [Holothuria leucospilota]|uniref:Death domain-containing protein 1 n=1 Tax=Holothuria leucospilota TaxID=206669 RepID=A0A9Q1BJ72_HOLLE|nr:Death domain-containing protein 1 [Holothuria leucospilota]